MRKLIANNVNVNDAIPESGLTALFMATLCGNTGLIKVLVEGGADINATHDLATKKKIEKSINQDQYD